MHLVNCEQYLNFRPLLPIAHDNFFVVEESTFRSTLYKSSMALAIDYQEDLPVFGILKFIIKPNDNIGVLFVLSGLCSVGFNEHFQCYEILPSND